LLGVVELPAVRELLWAIIATPRISGEKVEMRGLYLGADAEGS
jgi:hypothetical protein